MTVGLQGEKGGQAQSDVRENLSKVDMLFVKGMLFRSDVMK